MDQHKIPMAYPRRKELMNNPRIQSSIAAFPYVSISRVVVFLALPTIALAGISGCGSKTTVTDEAIKKADPKSGLTSALRETQQVPENLKGDAFVYYGLSNLTPRKLKIEVTGENQQTLTGTQTISLKETRKGFPVFLIGRTDSLTVLGTQEVQVEKDGIYSVASSVAKVGTHDLEMPNDLSPGHQWTVHTEVDSEKAKMVNDSTFRVEGIQKIKTPVAEREALLISSTGEGSLGNQKMKTTTQSWYVKNVGEVKTVITTTASDGKVQTFTISEVN